MRYLKETPTLTSETTYDVEDGVLVDYFDTIRSHSRTLNEATRLPHTQSAAERFAEEMEWAARSGPVTTRSKA